MKRLSVASYQQIRTWVYRNARPLELALWQYSFESGSKENVVSALTFYQNEDGGFGNALEPDNWNPDSSPYVTLHAINILKQINFIEPSHSVYQGIIKFLESGKYFSGNGWFFSIPSNDSFPHAPWWTYNTEANKTENIGLTAEISAFILKYSDQDSTLYTRAKSASKHVLGMLRSHDKYGDMGINGYLVLLDTLKNDKYKNEFDVESLYGTVKNLVYKSIERDVSKWTSYGVLPSNYITTPDSMFYKENEDIVQTELDYLIDTLPQNDVWGITWTWFENNGKYAKEFAISENWWKAFRAIEKVSFLKNFGRVELL